MAIHVASLLQFSSIFPPDMNISERQAQALATSIRVNGTNLLKFARNLFLWKNLTNSVLVRKNNVFGISIRWLDLVRIDSLSLLLHWLVDECVDIRTGRPDLSLHCAKDLSGVSGLNDPHSPRTYRPRRSLSQVPIDRTAKQVLDQINQLLAK
jgi:hypothetical protein